MPNKACAPGGGHMRLRLPRAPFARPSVSDWESADGAWYSQSAVVVKAAPYGAWGNGFWEVHPYGVDRGIIGPFDCHMAARRWWDTVVYRGRACT